MTNDKEISLERTVGIRHSGILPFYNDVVVTAREALKWGIPERDINFVLDSDHRTIHRVYYPKGHDGFPIYSITNNKSYSLNS